MQNTDNIIAAIESITADGSTCRLIDIRNYMVRRFGVILETTAISAEIRRSCRPSLHTKARGFRTIDSKQVSPLQKVHTYWIRRMTKQEKEQAQ